MFRLTTYHCPFIDPFPGLWTQCRQWLAVFLGTFSSWHRHCPWWYLSVLKVIYEGVDHGIKFTCDMGLSRGWKTFGMLQEWEGYFLLFGEKIKELQLEKRPPYGFYCHLSFFFPDWLKIKKRESKLIWETGRTVKRLRNPIFRTFWQSLLTQAKLAQGWGPQVLDAWGDSQPLEGRFRACSVSPALSSH